MNRRVCLHCNQTEKQHANGKCLFGPGTFTPRPLSERDRFYWKNHVLKRFTNETYCGTPCDPLLLFTFERYEELERNLATDSVCRKCIKRAADDLAAFWRKP